MKRVSSVPALLLVFAWTGIAGLQSPQRDQDGPLKLKADLVTVSAAVTDRNGNPIKSLKAEDFIIYEDGVRQKISHFASGDEPASVLLLLDISGSTARDIQLVKRAATNFLAELRPKDRVGLIVFSGNVELTADFSDSRVRVEAAINAIATPLGDEGSRFGTNTGTSFYDALLFAVEEGPLNEVEGRKAIVCMSDGVDSTSRAIYDNVSKLVEQAEASVYFLELDTEAVTLDGLLKPRTDPDYVNFSQSQVERYFNAYNRDSTGRFQNRHTFSPEVLTQMNHALFELARRQQREMAQRTGGRVYPVRALMDLAGVYKQLANELRAQYSIGYYSNNSGELDGRWHTIRVEGAGRAAGAIVHARAGYWAK